MKTKHILRLGAIGVVVFLYVGSVVYTQYFLNSTFYTDQRIYQDAATKLTAGQNPYQPFQIPVSFVYPPAIEPLFAFFNIFPFDIARVIWTDLSILAYLGALVVIWQWLKPTFTWRNILIFGALLFYGPLSENLTVGQVDTFNLLGLSLFVWGQSRIRPSWLGATGLALASLIKFTPGMLGLVLLRFGDWKRLGQTAIVSGLLASISLITFGLSAWIAFLEIIPQLVVSGSSDPNNQRLTTTLAHFLNTTEDNSSVRLVGSIFSFVVIAAWLGLLFWRGRRDDQVPVVLLGIVAMTISSSLIWYHHFLFLLLPILYLIIYYEGTAISWLGWFSLAAIQADRMVEHAFHWPPVLSLIGYVTIFVGMAIVVYQSAVYATIMDYEFDTRSEYDNELEELMSA